MIFFEYYDKNTKKYYLAQTKWYKYLLLKFFLWIWKGDCTVDEVKRILKKDIFFEE